jgi:hypothetical protein
MPVASGICVFRSARRLGEVVGGQRQKGRKILLFLKKTKQKDFYQLVPRHASIVIAAANGQEFFASFLQKRRPSLLTSSR